jgi:antitoxin FitA
MAQVLVHLDEEALELLLGRATLRGHSLEQEVREILTRAARPSGEERIALADEVRRLTLPEPQSDSTQLVREDRLRPTPADPPVPPSSGR